MVVQGTTGGEQTPTLDIVHSANQPTIKKIHPVKLIVNRVGQVGKKHYCPTLMEIYFFFSNIYYLLLLSSSEANCQQSWARWKQALLPHADGDLLLFLKIIFIYYYFVPDRKFRLPYLGEAQQLQEQHYPFLSVCCVQHFLVSKQ